jgi:hypothetical protein
MVPRWINLYRHCSDQGQIEIQKAQQQQNSTNNQSMITVFNRNMTAGGAKISPK